MKKVLWLFSFLFVVLSGLAFADYFNIKLYPGLYLGGDQNRAAYDGWFTIGADIQLGFEFGDITEDSFVVGIFVDAGIDTGQPNEPNFYYGGTLELYLFGLGMALGGGWLVGVPELKTDDRPLYDTIYIRLGLPLHTGERVKFGFYFDLYINVGSRLGFIVHF
jgi:hypothetical protein